MANDHSAIYTGDTGAFSISEFSSFVNDTEARAWERSLYSVDTGRELAELTKISDLSDRQSNKEVLNLLWGKADQGWNVSGGVDPYTTAAGSRSDDAAARAKARQTEGRNNSNRSSAQSGHDSSSYYGSSSSYSSSYSYRNTTPQRKSGSTYRSTYGTTRTDASSTKASSSKKRRTALDSAWDIISGVMEINDYGFGNSVDTPRSSTAGKSSASKRSSGSGKTAAGWSVGNRSAGSRSTANRNKVTRNFGSQTKGNQNAASAKREPAPKSRIRKIMLIILLIYIIAILTSIILASNVVNKHDLSPNHWFKEMSDDNTTWITSPDQYDSSETETDYQALPV